MTETIIDPDTQKTPTVVLVSAILNFISCAFFVLIGLIAGTVMVFGNAMGWYARITQVVNDQYPNVNLGIGLTFIITVVAVACVVSFLLTLLLGIGLLQGKKWAWFGQVASSIVGLIGFPVSTVINIILLIFLFQPNTRNFFKV
jgi:disulfide bond formation protein DsbB